MDRARQGPGWPHHELSRFVPVRPHRWHLQDTGGEGPVLLLLHGAGASSHSWRGLLPRLAPRFRILAPDLPGQGFTRAGRGTRRTPEAMAADLARLLGAEGLSPAAIVGHSAGAAVALRLAQALPAPPRAVVGINAALANFRGLAGWLFPALARLMALNPLTAQFLALGSSAPTVARLIESTGSRLDAEGIELYRRLMADRRHVAGTLAMMAQWRLDPLIADLPRIALPVLLIAGGRDAAVPPGTAAEAAARLPAAEVATLPGLGHLAHEEAPEAVAALIAGWLGPRLAAAGAPQFAGLGAKGFCQPPGAALGG